MRVPHFSRILCARSGDFRVQPAPQTKLRDQQRVCHSDRREEPAFPPTPPHAPAPTASPVPTPSPASLLLHSGACKSNCTTQLVNGLYHLNAHRRTGGRAVPYLPGEIDFLAAFIIPEDTWYIIPLGAFLGSTSLLFRRRRDPRPGLYDAYREAWPLLRPDLTTCETCGANTLFL